MPTFIDNVIARLDIGSDRTRVALITFSDVHLTEIRFDYTDYTNKESLRDEAKAVLDSLTPLGTTHIGNAIKVLLEELNQNGRGYRGASESRSLLWW
jgi:hypothetical protein